VSKRVFQDKIAFFLCSLRIPSHPLVLHWGKRGEVKVAVKSCYPVFFNISVLAQHFPIPPFLSLSSSSSQFFECVSLKFSPPRLVLSTTTIIARFAPSVLFALPSSPYSLLLPLSTSPPQRVCFTHLSLLLPSSPRPPHLAFWLPSLPSFLRFALPILFSSSAHFPTLLSLSYFMDTNSSHTESANTHWLHACNTRIHAEHTPSHINTHLHTHIYIHARDLHLQ
jgi:hypothetical protein